MYKPSYRNHDFIQEVAIKIRNWDKLYTFVGNELYASPYVKHKDIISY